jgi:hypothetical protein
VTLRRVTRWAAAAAAGPAGAIALAGAATSAGAAAAAPAPVSAAAASFTAPVELAAARYGLGAAAATDAAGAMTVLITGSGAPKLLERAPGTAWPPPARLPGDPRGVKGPVVAAAGQGALAIAWRVDKPRKYAGIQAEVRDPGGTLSTPIVVAGDDAGGVRHPALAADPVGDALLAYNTDTRKSHLSMRGAIAVTYRRAGGSFARPVVVDDEPSQPPTVALAHDGSGIVAWSHDRRVYAVSIAQGRLGKVKSVAASNGIDSLVVAAGPDGEATIAWSRSRDSHRGYEVRAVRRFAGRSFGPARVVRSTTAYISEVALAAEESGRATIAWTEDEGGDSGGQHGLTTFVRSATASPGHGFGAPRVVAASGRRYRQSLSMAAANGRVALAWGYKLDNRHVGVQAAVGGAGAFGPTQTIASTALTGSFYVTPPTVRMTLDPGGAATVLAVLPSEPAPRQIASRLVAIEGR